MGKKEQLLQKPDQKPVILLRLDNLVFSVAALTLEEPFIIKMSKVSGSLKRFMPMFDRILVQRADAVTKTKGGIIIPEKAQGKVLEATVVAAGPGARNEKGDTVPLSIAVGDKVLLPEFGGSKIEIDAKEYTLLRESDIMAKFGPE